MRDVVILAEALDQRQATFIAIVLRSDEPRTCYNELELSKTVVTCRKRGVRQSKW